MPDEIRIEGMTLAAGVLDKIVSVATCAVEGVASVGSGGIAGLVHKAGGRDVDVAVEEDGDIVVSVHISVAYGRPLRDVAAEVQTAVAEAVSGQIGRDVDRVDVFIDAVAFED